MIQPQWWQLDIFSIWQRSRNSRCYFGQVKPAGFGMSRIGRLWRLLALPRVAEPVNLDDPVPELAGNQVVVFSGVKNYFGNLLDHQELIRRDLFQMANTGGYLSTMSRVRAGIVVHVRLGDFVAASSNVSRPKIDYNQRVPIAWYIEAVCELRLAFGEDLPIYVVSDGTEQELAALLALKGCERLHTSDIGGMLLLSCARFLVASGSTYSMWGSFLGQMPVLWPPGQRRQRLYPQAPAAEPEWHPGSQLPTEFLEIDARRDAKGWISACN